MPESRSAGQSNWFHAVAASVEEMIRHGELNNLYWAVDLLRTYRAGPGDFNQAEQFLDLACTEYLRCDEARRETIRRLFGKEAWYELVEYSDLQARKIISPTDIDSVRISLAACSIAGLRIDYRDLLLALGYIHSKAESAGIDPRPYFSEIADLSDEEPRNFKLSTADLFRGFYETRYFKSLSDEKR